MQFVNGKTLNYGCCFIWWCFGFVWNVGGSPDINSSFTANANNWAYVFGIIGHHFI
jgi:hypothetical protein